MDLLARRENIVRRHKTLSSVPGSGWHKDDPQERRRLEKGEQPLCDRVVAFQDDDLILVVGPCVRKIRGALEEYVTAEDAYLKTIAPGSQVKPEVLHALKIARRVLAKPADDVIGVTSQEWNGCVYALKECGVLCVLADANNTPEEEKVLE